MGYYGNEVFIFAWDLDVSFLGIPNWVIRGFLIFFFHFGFKGVMEKCVGCFLVYLFFFYFFFWGGRLLKRCEKWGVYVIALKSYIHVLFMFFSS